ncbi:MAG: hypothetical protein ABGY09_06095 [Euryarchaeota archaeon]
MRRAGSASTPPRQIWEWVLALLLTLLTLSAGVLWKRYEITGKPTRW